MGQINIRVNDQMDHLFQILADNEKKPKALVVKEILVKNLREKLLYQFLKEYEKGKISLKKISLLFDMTPQELFQEISDADIVCPITPELDEYTTTIMEKIINNL